MLKVGLTGGLASGKTFIGQTLVSMGCHLIQADELGHRVLSPGGEAYDAVIREFGSSVLGPDGVIDRKQLAELVFDRPDRLERLNELVHPPVIRLEEELMAVFAAEDPHGIGIVEAAILIETGSYRRFERLIIAVCTVEQQIERAMKRDAVTRDQALARLSRQMPLIEKQKFADYVIDTSGTKEDTVRQTRAVYEELRSFLL